MARKTSTKKLNSFGIRKFDESEGTVDVSTLTMLAIPQGNIRDIIGLIRSGIVTDFFDLLDGFKNRDLKVIIAEILSILNALGFTAQAKELKELAEAIQSGNIFKIIKEAADVLISVVDEFQPQSESDNGGFTTAALRRRTLREERKAALKDPKTWTQDNADYIREGFNRPFIRFLLNRNSELRNQLTPEEKKKGLKFFEVLASGDKISVKAIDWAKVIAFIEKILPFLKLGAAAIPYLIPVVIVLELIVMIYHNNHPAVEGISLEDLFSLLG